MTREELNKEICHLARIYDRIILNWGTSVGKSKAAIDILNLWYKQKGDLKVLLLVAETAHKDNWQEQFDEWGLFPMQMTVECYASLNKYQNTEWDVIVADEAHHLNTENRLAILSTITIQKMICLSATIGKDLPYALRDIYGNFKIHKVDLQDSISYGILPEPEISLIGLRLDTQNKTETIVETWGPERSRIKLHCTFENRFSYKNRNKYPAAELTISCTPYQKYFYIEDQYEYWRKIYMGSSAAFAKNKWLHAGSDRKRFLGECKTKAAERVIQVMGEDSRFICFCTSIGQAENLGGSNAIHSKLKSPKKTAKAMIESFNTFKTNRIFAINMLQEGMNLKKLDWGMIIQLDGCDRGWIQKIGRMMRSQKPKIAILYYKDTKDEDYLDKVLNGINKDYIKHYSLNA